MKTLPRLSTATALGKFNSPVLNPGVPSPAIVLMMPFTSTIRIRWCPGIGDIDIAQRIHRDTARLDQGRAESRFVAVSKKRDVEGVARNRGQNSVRVYLADDRIPPVRNKYIAGAIRSEPERD